MRAYLSKIIGTGKLAGIVSLFMMMALTAGDVCARYLLRMPIRGNQDITELLMVPLVFLGLAYTSEKGGHIRVEIVTARMPSRFHSVLSIITNSLSAAVAVLMSWRLLINFLSTYDTGEKTIILKIPIAPFVLVSSLGCAILSVELILKVHDSLMRLKEDKTRNAIGEPKNLCQPPQGVKGNAS